MSGTDLLMVKRRADLLAPGIWTVGGQGNSMLVDHGDGLLLVDAGPGGEITDRMIEDVGSVSDKPVTHIVISHGHTGYNFGVAQWNEQARARGQAEPLLVGHERVAARYRRYRETAGLQAHTNSRQFRTAFPAEIRPHWFIEPRQTYRDAYTVHGRERDVVLLHAPSETDDATAVWVPSERVLYASCACIKSCPNAGSPYRIHRDPMRWADTLERLRALDPGILVPEFGRPLLAAADIDEALMAPVRAIRWLRAEVVARMNRGMSEDEIVHDLRYPDELFGGPFMRPVYGCPEWIAREVWRSENGWWDRNPTTLHPEAATDVASAVLAAIGDPQPVLERARVLAAEARTQMALHVVDLVALGPSGAPGVEAARALKADLLRRRAAEVTSAVSRNLMLSESESLRRLPIGSTSQSRDAEGFSWT